MSGPLARSDGPANDTGNLPARYEVGYARPPAEHRFQKGRSGNPGGRPRGAKNKAKPLDPAIQPTDSLILLEAYRPVTIREGDKVIELPAIQAAIRSLAISAMKGSRLSQKALAEIVREVEQRRSADHAQILENAFIYKQKWTAELKRRKALGIDEPDPIPHPDDVHIDMRTGKVSLEGPADQHEKQMQDGALARRDEAQEEVNYFADLYRPAKSEDRKDRYLEDWHWEQRMFDLINDTVKGRYKAKLENRSHAPGASREGKTLAEVIRNRKLRDEYVG